jgi:hypothetical protein
VTRTPRSSRIVIEPVATSGRSLRGRLTATALALLGVLCAADALAAGEKDGEANKLYDAAMNDDYLNVELGKAEKKLNDAIKKCGSDGCTPKVLAKVYLGLGVIHFANNKADAAKEAFINGLKADASATLDPTFKGAEIDKIFDEAKKSAGKGGGDSGSKGGGDSGEGGSKGGGDSGEGGKKPGGGLKHTPPTEQQVNTPVPIYIEVPEDLGIKKVTLRYKPFGATAYKPVDMQKVGSGWGIEIPCTEVGTTGDLKYYITADDDAGTVDSAGSRNEPYKVAIKNEIEGDPPALPGKKPPKQCSSSTDCPPGFPGCVDSQCSSDGDCKSGLQCSRKEGDSEGTCKRKASEGKPWGSSCSESSECGEGLACVEGSCQEGASTDKPKQTTKVRKNMFTLEAGLDLLLINGRDGVCSGKDADGNINDGSFVCFYSEGGDRTGQFYGVPNNAAGTNGVSGGFGVAGGRFGVGFDRQLTDKIRVTLGLHLGFALSGFPSSDTPPTSSQVGYGFSQANGFLPFWGELRAGYNFLGGMVEDLKFRPYAYVGFGIGQVNAGVPVTVCDTKNKAGDAIPSNTSQGDCPKGSVFENVDAYQITGLNYIPIGFGSTFGIKKGFGLKAELRVIFMVPTFGVVFQPQIGPVYAF